MYVPEDSQSAATPNLEQSTGGWSFASLAGGVPRMQSPQPHLAPSPKPQANAARAVQRDFRLIQLAGAPRRFDFASQYDEAPQHSIGATGSSSSPWTSPTGGTASHLCAKRNSSPVPMQSGPIRLDSIELEGVAIDVHDDGMQDWDSLGLVATEFGQAGRFDSQCGAFLGVDVGPADVADDCPSDAAPVPAAGIFPDNLDCFADLDCHSSPCSSVTSQRSSPPSQRVPPGSLDRSRGRWWKRILMALVRLLEPTTEKLDAYINAVPVRYPCCCSAIGMVILMLLCAIVPWLSITLEKDFGNFMKADVPVSIMRDAYYEAKAHRADPDTMRRLGSYDIVLTKEFYLAFEILEGNLFDVDVQEEILQVENALIRSKVYRDLCAAVWSDTARFCDPGFRLANYLLPESVAAPGNVVPSYLNISGRGTTPIPHPLVFSILNDHDVTDIIMPAYFDESDPGAAKVVRSVFRFEFQTCTSTDPEDVCAEGSGWVAEAWDSAIKEFIRIVRGQLGEVMNIRISYDGSGVDSIEVVATLNGDISIGFGAMAFVLVYLVFHTRSIFMSIMGISIVFLSIPASLVITATIGGVRELTVTFALSIFLVIGLGSDVIFVYNDFWQDSGINASPDQTYEERALEAFKRAARSSLVTSVTTSISFFANLASALKPLREFGFFMGVCVMLVWTSLFFVFVPVCIADERYFRRLSCRRNKVAASGEKPTDTLNQEPGVAGRVRRLGLYSQWVYRWRKPCFVGPVGIALIMLIWASCSFKLDTSVPDIFPEDHNQHHAKEVFGEFVDILQALPSMAYPPPAIVKVCSEYDFSSESTRCLVYWCEMEPGMARTAPGTCVCNRDEIEACAPGASSAVVTQRYVTQDPVTYDQHDSIAKYMQETSHGLYHRPSGPDIGTKRLPDILVEDWETGEAYERRLYEVAATMLREGANASCGWNDVCFCDAGACRVPRHSEEEWYAAPPLVLFGSRRLQGSAQSGRPALPRPRSHAKAERRLSRPAVFERSAPLGAGSTVLGVAWFAPAPTTTTWRDPTFGRHRRLGETSGGASVQVVFGIELYPTSSMLGGQDTTGTWSFLPLHEMSEPQAQRELLSFCTDLHESLQVAHSVCWIDSFKAWLGGRNRFPVPKGEFHDLAMLFGNEGLVEGVVAKDFFWIRDGEVKASSMSFQLSVSEYADTSTVLNILKAWDDYVEWFNQKASRGVEGTFHTSSLWVRAEAQSALVASTAATLTIALLLAFLTMVVFTADLSLSIYVVLSTMSVISALLWFILVLMGWRVGPIEVIALIVFVGYATTYSLHISHKYGNNLALSEWAPATLCGVERVRFQRTVFALKSIGGAALGSACTTAGCSIFLCFCTLTIFVKLGAVVLVVTFVSVLTAFLPLPSLLFLLGPVEPGRCFKGAISKLQLVFKSPRLRLLAPGRSAGPPDGAHDSLMPPCGPAGDADDAEDALARGDAGAPAAAPAQPLQAGLGPQVKYQHSQPEAESQLPDSERQLLALSPQRDADSRVASYEVMEPCDQSAHVLDSLPPT